MGCEYMVEMGCSALETEKENAPEDAVQAICVDDLRLCSSEQNVMGIYSSAHFCGCLEPGQCVDPFSAASDCCSGNSRMNGFMEHCDKDHHNHASPWRCL